MTSKADRARDMGGVPELLSWKERYSKNNKFSYMDQLAVQMRRGATMPTRGSTDGSTAAYLTASRDTQDWSNLDQSAPRNWSNTRPRSRAGHMAHRDQLHELYTSTASQDLERNFGPNSSLHAGGSMEMMRNIPTHSMRSDTSYELAPTSNLRRAIETLQPPAPIAQFNPQYRKNPSDTRRPESREKRLSSYFPFGSTYQINHLVHPFSSLDVSHERYGHPRDALVDYRNNVKRSMGKASFFVKGPEEQSLQKFDMTINRNLRGELLLKKKD